MNDNKPFQAHTTGIGKINLTKHAENCPILFMKMRPIAIYHKSDGSIEDEDSFCVVMEDLNGMGAHGEISLKMLNDGLNDIGFKIVEI